MKKQDFRRALNDIRWTPEQRRAFEEKLRQPANQARDDWDEQQFAEFEAGCAETLRQIEQRKQEGKHMKITGKTIWIILAAALLAAGGVAGAVAAMGKHGDGIPQGDESSGSVPPLDPDAKLQPVPHLTEQTDPRNLHMLCDVGTGFCYLGDGGLVELEKDENGVYTDWSARLGKGSRNIFQTALYYADRDTGENVHFCARPNCLHDGNEFCISTSKYYTGKSKPVYLDGALWLVAKDESARYSDTKKPYSAVLLRYDLDGTEITRVKELFTSDEEFEFAGELIAHRGQLWIRSVYISGTPYKDDYGETQFETKGDYDLWCYEPEAEKLTRLAGHGELQNGYRPYWSDCDFQGAGDYVYFYKESSDWQDPLKSKTGVFQIDCRRGAIELMIAPERSGFDYIGTYAACEKGVYFTDIQTNTDTDKRPPADLCFWDANFHERTKVCTFQDVFDTVYPDTEMTKKRIFDSTGMTFDKIIATDEKVYLVWHFINMGDDVDVQDIEHDYITAMDFGGNILETYHIQACFPADEEYVREQTAYYQELYKDADPDSEKYKALMERIRYEYISVDSAGYADGVFYFEGNNFYYALDENRLSEDYKGLKPVVDTRGNQVRFPS